MRVIREETCPLPDDPTLAAMAESLNKGGYWAELFDRDWRGIYLTDDARQIYGGRVEPAPYPLGVHIWAPEKVAATLGWSGGQFPLEIQRRIFALMAHWVLADTPGGREELKELVDPRLADIVDEISPAEPPPATTFSFRGIYSGAGAMWTFCSRSCVCTTSRGDCSERR